MTRLRLYTVANDRMIGHFRRFADYLFAFMPDAQLSVIPFDHEIEQLRYAVAADSRLSLVPAQPEWDEIGRRLFAAEDYRPHLPSWRYFRKLNAFTGHDENFVFLDVNCLVVADLERYLGISPLLSGGCYFGARSLPQRTIKDEFARQFLSAINPDIGVGYNCGMIASRGGLVDLDLAAAIARPQLRKVIGQAPEQGFLALYLAFFGIRHGQISDLHPQVASVLSQLRLAESGDGTLRAAAGPEQGKIKIALKYTGQQLAEIPLTVQAFYTRVAGDRSPAGRG